MGHDVPVTESPPPAAAVGRRPVRHRLVALDVTRTAAILGMIAVHVGGSHIRQPTGPWQVLSLASGFAAGTFAVAAGVALSLTNPARGDLRTDRGAADPVSGGPMSSGPVSSGPVSGGPVSSDRVPTHRLDRRRARSSQPWLPTVVRGVVLFVLGLLVEPLSGGVLVILCVYGAIFVVAAPLRGLSARALATLGLALLVLWPIASLAIRRQLTSAPNLELSVQVLDQPGWPLAVLRILFLDGTYPVPTWLALVLLAWAAHRSGLLVPQRRSAQAAVSAALIIVGFGGAALVESLWHPRRQLIQELVGDGWSATAAEIGADHALGVPNAPIWPSLLTAGHHTGTSFELLQILAVAMTTYTLAGYLSESLPALATVLAWPGRIALTIYIGHLALLWVTGWFWLGSAGLGASDPQSLAATAMPAFWALMAFWGGAFLIGALLRNGRGPVEAMVRLATRPRARPVEHTVGD